MQSGSMILNKVNHNLPAATRGDAHSFAIHEPGTRLKLLNVGIVKN